MFWRTIAVFTTILTLLIIIQPATAAANNTKILQGDCVQVGNYYDIGGIGWNNGYISWYGKYYDYLTPDENQTKLAQLAIPFKAGELSMYYIDPAIFGKYLGYWYMDSTKYEPNGNTRLFKVQEVCVEPTVKPTVSATTTPEPETRKYPLVEKKESDILIARGDSLSMNINTPATYWFIGTRDSIYDQAATNNKLRIPSESTAGFQAGNYILDIITPGKNTIIEELYNRNLKEIYSPFRAFENKSIDGIQPKIVEEYLHDRITKYSDDQIVSYDIAFQEPTILIERADPNTGNTFLKISGYTNVAVGTVLTITVDPEDRLNSTQIRVVTVDGGGQGYWRQFSENIPFDVSELSPGLHTIQMTSPQGAIAQITPYIREEPPENYKPKEYLRYVDNSPYITPVTVTITIPVPGPTRIVKETITPSKEDWESYAAAQAEYEKKQKELADKEARDQAIPRVLTVGAIILIGYIGYSMYRSRKMKQP